MTKYRIERVTNVFKVTKRSEYSRGETVITGRIFGEIGKHIKV